MGSAGIVSFPLPPQHLAQLSSHPLLQLFKRPLNLSQLEVISPASQDRVQLLFNEAIEPATFCSMELLPSFSLIRFTDALATSVVA